MFTGIHTASNFNLFQVGFTTGKCAMTQKNASNPEPSVESRE